MSYDIPENLKNLEEKIINFEKKIINFEIKITNFENQHGTVSGPVVPHEVNPEVGNVQAKVAAIERNLHLLNNTEFELLDPTFFNTDNFTLINKFLNILTIIEKNSNNADATLKSALDDKLKEKYIIKGQQLFDETTKHIQQNIDIFCNNEEAIKAYFTLFNIIQNFYSNLIKKEFPYKNLYELMKKTKNQINDNDFNKYINKLIRENNKKYLEIKNNPKTIRGGRKTRKIKHRKTKRRGNGNKKSHKKRNSKSHKKRH